MDEPKELLECEALCELQFSGRHAVVGVGQDKVFVFQNGVKLGEHIMDLKCEEKKEMSYQVIGNSLFVKSIGLITELEFFSPEVSRKRSYALTQNK